MDTIAAPQSRAQFEAPEDIKKIEANPDKARVLRWLSELQNSEKVFEGYHKRADEIARRYRDEREEGEKNTDRRYNALWSMTQTLKPLLFGEHPVPFVTRQHDDDDPQGRDAALLLQRLLTVKAESDHFYDALNEAVDDYVLAGRGTTWVTYMPEFATRESDIKTFVESEDEIPEDPFGDETEGERPPYKSQTDDTGKMFYRERYEYKARESCILESVNLKDLLHGPATRWRHVPWVARRVPMLRSEARKRFGNELADKLPLAAKEAANPRMTAPNTDDFKGQFARAVVWEIWDKVERKIVWICPDFPDKILDEKDDELKLEGFFPCAKPMFGTMTNDTLLPVPDYTEWQDIALELDDVTLRIHMLIGALRVVGVYSQEYGAEIKQLLDPKRRNEMIAVANWAMFAEKGGLKGAVDFFPIENVVQTLDKLYEVRTRLVQEMYEITGISDIVRGASDPRETASAQKLKGSFANARLTGRQKMVARHARESLAIIAEIVCSLYSDETMLRMSGALQLFRTDAGAFDTPRWHAALNLLRDEPLRMLRVKIDTESLAESTITSDRDEATQFLQGLTSYLQQSVAMLQMAPKMGPLLGKLMLFAVRKFRVGRGLESDIDSALRQLAKTGLGQPMDEKGKGSDGMNSLEAQVEMDRNNIDREKLQIERERMEMERQKVGLQGQKQADESGARHTDIGIKQFKAVQDVRIRDKQIDVQAQGQAAQHQLAAQDQRHTQNVDQQQLAQDQQATHADIQMRGQEMQHGATMEQQQFEASREDAAHDRESGQRDFEASRADAALDRQERQVDRQHAQTNAAADRKVKVQQSKQKPAKPKKPKGA